MITKKTDRLEYVDTLRGFALFGVCWANLLIFSGIVYMTDAQRAMLSTTGSDRIAYLIERIFIENKFMGLFSFLFGVSFWLFLDRTKARGSDGPRLFYWRIGWLFVIGAIHGWLLWCFDILRFYALWGMLLPAFRNVSRRTLLSVALFCSLLAPALVMGFRSLFGFTNTDSTIDSVALQTFSSAPYGDVLRVNWRYDWYLTISVSQIGYQVAVLGRLLLGLFAARSLVLTDLKSHSRNFLTILVVGSILGIGGNIIGAGNYLQRIGEGGFVWPFLARLIEEFGYLGLTLAYASGLALLFQVPRWARYLRLLSPIGRMALTFYLLQTLFGLWLFYGFMPGPHLMGKIGPAWILGICIVSFTLQVWFASNWLPRFRFGPAEWLWRSLTYRKIQPFKI